MGLLAEMERIISAELTLLNDDTAYLYTGTSTAWQTLKNYGNVTLAEAGLLILSYAVYVSTGSGNVRLKIGDNYVTGGLFTSTYGGKQGVIWLAAGTYTVLVEGKKTSTGTDSVQVSLMKMGFVKFNDTSGAALAVYADAITQNKVVARNTPTGAISKQVLILNVQAMTPSCATPLDDVGETNTHGINLSIDGSRVNWTEQYEDGSTTYSATMGRYVLVGSLADHVIAIGKNDANTVVYVSVVLSPWLLPPVAQQAFPVTLGISQFSTLYVTYEPLFINPTKNSYIGKVRGISFGAATDWYSTATGTGVLPHTYTFESLQVSQAVVLADGWGGCISMVAADIR